MNDRLLAFIQLTRLDKPVGTFLLLWPTLAALWIAADGVPGVWILTAFVAGTFVVRAAGCVINDIADRDFDRHVQRTENRPLTQGRVSLAESYAVFVVLALIGLVIVMTLNVLTQLLAAAGILIVIAYPFMKRWTYLPQVVLGVAFSWGIPMAFAAAAGTLPEIAWLMFTASLLWIVAYDTEYAMVDRRYDLEVGIKSTAILFGQNDRVMIGVLQLSAFVLFVLVGLQAGFRHVYYVALIGVAALFVHQQRLIKNREEDACFAAFRNNTWVGLALFAGAAAEYAVANMLAASE